jgi:molybdate transport system substrate-binding protein
MKSRAANYAFTGLALVLTAVILVYQYAGRTGRIQHKSNLPDRIVVFAAAGLTQAVQDCAQIFQKQPGCRVELNLASSAVLARQIVAGAPWDVYLSANRQWMEYLLEQTGRSPDTAAELAGDRLALVTPVSQSVAFSLSRQFAEKFTGRLATGDPQSVPVGFYARQALENLGWWDELSDNLVPAVNVSAALRYVEAGQCEFGIVYLSGAKMSRKVNIIHVFDESLHEPIRFLAAARAGSERGGQFLAFLNNAPQAAQAFQQNGFEAAGGRKEDEP